MTKAKRQPTHGRKALPAHFDKYVWVWIVSAVLSLALAAGLCVWHYAAERYDGPQTWVYIPSGSTQGQVRDSLTSTLGAEMGGKVYTLWRWQDGNPEVSHGAYRVDLSMPAWRIARNIAKGMQTPITVRFAGMRTVDNLAAWVSAKMEFDSAEFIAALDSVLAPAGFKSPAQYPAAFIPNTHQVYWSESASDFAQRLLDDRNRFWNPERRARAKALGLTPVEVATLASIVEEETNKRDERPMVARLYLNRLDAGMKLQADPTVKFAFGDPTLRRITNTSVDSPYNTYKYWGLPPGPIRIVEPATIDSVLQAPRHDYLYMCAKEDFSGRHNFACDYSTHLRNASRYQAELDRRGINR